MMAPCVPGRFTTDYLSNWDPSRRATPRSLRLPGVSQACLPVYPCFILSHLEASHEFLWVYPKMAQSADDV